MRRFGWLKSFIFLVVFLVPFFLTSCGGGGGGNSNTSNASGNNGGNEVQVGNSQAALGPLSGAIIKAYKIDNLTTPIEVTTATKSNDIKTAGTFTLNLKGVPDNEWILVTASGGNDIDPYDNGTAASAKVQNQGTIHALAKAGDWRKGGKINILTELAWQEIEPELKTDNSTAIENQLNLLASQLLSDDVNGDGKITYQDLLAFNPENKKERYKLSFQFSDIMKKDNNHNSLIDYIHNNKPDQEKNRISSMFGNKVGLPTAPLKMIPVKPTIILPDNSTISSSSLKVSSFFSNSPEIENSNKATILMADDSKGDTVLLGYALPSTYTKAITERLLDRGSSEFTRLASGSTGDNPELSPKSTALALVMMIAGGNNLTTNEKTSIINYVLNSSNFDKLVSDISNAIAADPTFLHNINTPKYASIVTEIKTIAKNAIDNYINTIKNEKSISYISYIFYNTMMTRSIKDITPIQPTEIDSFWSTPIVHSPHSPWYPDQPWYWYGSANDTNVTAPPFLAADKYNKELFALANPDNIYYAALFYNKTGRLIKWYFTKRNRTMIEKVVNSGAAQRTIYYGDQIDNNITHIQFNKDWFSGGWSWSDGALPVRLIHFLDLSISVVDVIADAGPLAKAVGGFVKHTRNIQKALEASGCIASVTDIVSFGNNDAKDFLSDAILPALKAVPVCLKVILKNSFGMGIEGAINSLVKATIPKLAAKLSNPGGWVMLVASAADNLVPFGTSLLFAPSTVGYDISWNGNTIASVWRDDDWESSNSSTHTVSGTVSGLANGKTVVLLAKLSNSSNTTPITIPILTNGKHDFITNIPDGSSYTITVAQDPNGQTCTVTNGSGTVSGTDVTDVTITCTTTTTADTTPPSTPTGLTAKAVSPTQINLSWNASTDNVGVVGYKIYRNSIFDKTSSTTSVSDTGLSPSTKYCYTVTAYDAAGNESAKSNQVCVETLSQTISTYDVGGNVTGLNGTLVLQNNNVDTLKITSDGPFSFTGIADGSSYNITVKTQPIGQTCTVTNGSGTVSGTDVTDVMITCTSSAPEKPGSLDPTFGNGGVVIYDNSSGEGLSIAIDSQNRIIVVGDTNDSMTIWRYNPDGTLDSTFGNKGVVIYNVRSSSGYSVITDSQNRILVTGITSGYMTIWRYNPDGTLDSTFGDNGVVRYNSDSTGNSITINSQGKILVAGESWANYTYGYMTIWRYNPDGTLDSTFGDNGVVRYNSYSTGNSITINSQGKILVSGCITWENGDYYYDNMTVWRYNSNGTPDTSNNGILINSNRGGDIKAFALDSENKILIPVYDKILRYNPNGTIDTTFGIDGVAVYNSDYGVGTSVTVNSKGKIFVTGRSWTDYSNNNAFMTIWIYNSNGTSDTSFGVDGTITYNTPSDGNSITTDLNGKILITGDISGHMAIWRYLP